jgi:hypothetical protein
VKILGSILSEVPKTPEAWQNVETEFKHYGDRNRFIPCDYKSDGLYAAINMSLYYGQEKPYYVGMENVLRAISLFSWDVPAIVVEVIWRCLQPPGLVDCFNMVVGDLISKGLVEETTGSNFANGKLLTRDLEINPLVSQFVAMKLEPIDLPTILVDEGGVKGRKEILPFFLFLYGRNQVRLATIAHSATIIQTQHQLDVESLDLASYMFLLVCQAETASRGICEYWAGYILAYLNHKEKAKHLPDISVAVTRNMWELLYFFSVAWVCRCYCDGKFRCARRISQDWMDLLTRASMNCIFTKASMSLDEHSCEQIVGTTSCPGFLELWETLRFV